MAKAMSRRTTGTMPKGMPPKGMHMMNGKMMKDSDMPKGMGPKMMNKPGAKKK